MALRVKVFGVDFRQSEISMSVFRIDFERFLIELRRLVGIEAIEKSSPQRTRYSALSGWAAIQSFKSVVGSVVIVLRQRDSACCRVWAEASSGKEEQFGQA